MLNEDGEGPVEVLKGEKLCQMMDKFITLFSSNIRNLVASFKHWPRNRGYVSSIFAFKANSGYYFIQDHFFKATNWRKNIFVQDAYAWRW
jgi:hypothetical protein